MRSTYTIATSALLLAFGCEGKPLSNNRTGSTGTGGNSATGGSSDTGHGLGGTQTWMSGTGGMTSTGGVPATGGIPGAGGVSAAGGVLATGGVPATGGSTVVACTSPAKISADNCGAASTGIGNLRIDWYYDYVQYPFRGYAYVFISPTPNPRDTLVCYSSPFGSSGPTIFNSSWCGVGTVPADCTRNTVAGIGFNLNQALLSYWTPADGYPAPTDFLSVTIKSVTVAFINRANSDLRIQIAQYSGSSPIYYCSVITGMQSPATVATSHFTKTCWDSANPGATWDGTGAESIGLIIPGQASKPTPFDACIQDVQFL
jgi:hypothetical protein